METDDCDMSGSHLDSLSSASSNCVSFHQLGSPASIVSSDWHVSQLSKCIAAARNGLLESSSDNKRRSSGGDRCRPALFDCLGCMFIEKSLDGCRDHRQLFDCQTGWRPDVASPSLDCGRYKRF